MAELGKSIEAGGRRPLLDGLRGVAILLVVASHVGLLPSEGGSVGVTVFFVLSGFLITDLLIREQAGTGTIGLGRFYFRRAYRLVPALLVFLAGAAIIAMAYGRDPSWIWNETWPALFYVANYADLLLTDLSMNWHTWSLAVEEHFYLAWPLILLALPVARRIRVLGAGLVVLEVWSVFISSSNPTWGHAATDANLFALATGCLVAMLNARGVGVNVPSWAPLVGVSLIGVFAVVPGNVWFDPILVLVAAVTTWCCASRSDGVLAASPLRFLGRISYGLYLWHVPILMAAGTALGPRIAGVGLAVVVAWLSWIWVERPLLARRDAHWSALSQRRMRPAPLPDLVPGDATPVHAG
ncbi:MAG TPA: acyltransferase [Acidimicrobiia bacterium]